MPKTKLQVTRTPGEPKTSRASLVADALKQAIMRGDPAPGTKVNLDHLRDRFGVSLSPMREAISRLVSTGLVEFEDQRGYRIAPVSADDLAQVTRLRADLESLALRYAVQQGGLDWESRLMGALHRLDRTPRNDKDAGMMDAWETAHWDFHHALISACNMPMLLDFCQTLHNLNDRYRRIFLRNHDGDPAVRDDHRRITEAAVDRKADLAASLLREHIERTGGRLLAVISQEL